jgi:hypothetical protein
MKYVKKYYLVPENRYKVLIQRESDPNPPSDLSLKTEEGKEVEEEKSPSIAEEGNSPHLLVKSDTLREQQENKKLGQNPILSEEESEGSRSPFASTADRQQGGKLSSTPPPPGIPIERKKKRQLPWISL